MLNDNTENPTYLKCDVELELVGPMTALVDKTAAEVLRALADRIEKGEFQDGFTDVADKTGRKVGTIYVDYSGGD